MAEKTKRKNGGTDNDPDLGDNGRDPDLAAPRTIEVKPTLNGFSAHMIAKYGSAERALDELGAENATYRERHREDTELVGRLQDRVREGAAPAGGRILNKDEAAEFEAFTKLGKKAADVDKALKDGTAAVERLAGIEATNHISSVAAAAGYDPEVLTNLAKQNGFILSLAKQKVDGEEVEVAMVSMKEGEAPQALADVIEQKYPKYLPSLEASETEGETGKGESKRTVPVLNQRSTTTRQGSVKGKNSPVSDGVNSYRGRAYGANLPSAKSGTPAGTAKK